MKIYWATPGFDDWPLERWQQVLKNLSACGFAGIEPMIAGRYQLDAARIKELLLEHNQTLFGVRTGGIALKHHVFFNDQDDTRKKEAIDRFIDMTHYLAQFGTPRLLVGLIQGNLMDGQDRNEAFANIKRALLECARIAASHNMEIDLEAVNRFEVNHHNTASHARDFIKDIGAGNIRLLVDTFHMNIEEDIIDASMRGIKPILGHVHLADSNRKVPGKGHFDFESFFRTLKEIGYDGSLTIEAQTDSTREEIEHTMTFLRKIPCFEVEG